MGRPRLDPDRPPLTQAEKSCRWRFRQKGLLPPVQRRPKRPPAEDFGYLGSLDAAALLGCPVPTLGEIMEELSAPGANSEDAA
jgi:hypothetical protein